MKDVQNVADLTQTWSPVVWQHARLEVQMHGVAPLLYRRFLDNGALNLLDSSFQDYIKSQYLLNSKRIQRVQEILMSILLESDAFGVNVMPLKGSVLINEYYKNQALRPMSDIDLLIHAADEARMEKVLTSLGYYLMCDTTKHKVFGSNNRISSINGEHPDNPVKIEVHTRINCSIGFEQYDITEYMWKNAEQGFLKLKSIIKPSRTMLLMHLFFHAANNQYKGTLRAIQLYDIHLITRSFKDKEWRQLQEIVEDMECEKLVYVPLALAAQVFEIHVPDSVMNKLQLKTPKGLKSLINSYLLDEFIAINELATLKHLFRDIKLSFYKKILFLANSQITQIYKMSMQLKWHDPGKKKFWTKISLIKPPVSRIGRWGYLIGYLHTFLLFLTSRISQLTMVTRFRKQKINQLKLLIFRHETKCENIKINIVDNNEK